MTRHYRQRKHAWAVWHRELNCFVGRFWFTHSPYPQTARGLSLALFKTRAEARQAVAKRRQRKDLVPVKVFVKLEVAS